MKIKTKLVVGFTALLIIMLSLSLVSYDRMSYMNDQIDRVYQERYMKVRYSSGMRGEVNGIATELANQLLGGQAADLSASRVLIENAKGRAQTFWDSITSEKGSAEERRLVQNVGTSWENFSSYEANLMQLLENGDTQQAQTYRDTTGIELQRAALGALNELASYQDLQVEAEVASVKEAYARSTQITTAFLVVGLLLGLGIMLWIIPSVTRGLNTVSMMISSFGKGKLKAIRRIKVKSKDEIGSVATVFQQMAQDIEEKQRLEREYMEAQNDQAWINSNMARITDVLKGIMSLEKVSQTFVSEFTPILGAEYGALYLAGTDNPNELKRYGSYAFSSEPRAKSSFAIGEGLLGQSAADRRTILLDEPPQQYIEIGSALGESASTQILIHPIVAEEELIGVFEIASLTPFNPLQLQLLDQLLANLGVILNNINGRLRVEELLRESQALTEELQCQSEELQTQQEELKRSNENLESQAEALRRSEDLLQRQQEELEHFNTELIAKTRALEEQVHETEEKNREVELARVQLERQTMQLAVSSKYKSEFLANMSHELRTPLNSLLILSQLLAENKDGNLAPKQVEYAQTIYMSGADLLKMIDEILDLSKVDAGKMELNREPVPIEEIKAFVTNNFGAVAEKKGIELNVEASDAELPTALLTDGHRLNQVLRNLLSNAFKFTSDGSVTFRIRQADPEHLPDYLEKKRKFIEFSVIDTGIGIPQDKTDIVFEAFQQVDGTTSRKYGGTGLGLSISRELAKLLGGAIELESEEGQGSRFSLYIPKLSAYASGEDADAREEASAQSRSEERTSARSAKPAAVAPIEPKPKQADIEDDREGLAPHDKVLLIIEDDPKFAVILRDMARSYGYKAIVEVQGDTGLQTARSRMPDAIILDIQLPVIDGWTILSELKSSSETRHIPVHVVSMVDDVKQGLMMGAIAYLKKPADKDGLERAFSYIGSYADKSLKHLLIVEDDETQRNAIIELIGHDDVAIKAVGTGSQALEELQRHHYDCMVLDLMLSDMTGFEMLDRIREDDRLRDLPIIIYTGKDLDSKEETKLRQYAESIIVKDVKSPERLLDETTLFLHRVEADLPEDKRKILQKLHNKETLFEGKKILLVDDDVRNVFALSSVLEGYRMDVTFAENGREAIETLEERTDFDLILMDMMMPEMDGYEAMRLIRQMPGFERIPIIALTAKAMKEDRSKCIEAGASDYVKKPIQTEQLLSLMRVWLYS
ncbi:response regulator [Saccharibacillus brassicae]|uniref:Circadian input-output histidine kinase CikA n=1 Tax=Saccharibacillus brassicae TaxID=2583377 RepID=A0A4Y6USJ9_SACBS|nr:response regulator [Saccharibacillus brassicae]QDH20629.1 response regulator [Saccharibacillus brassicae]